jgi:hypothetical protein
MEVVLKRESGGYYRIYGAQNHRCLGPRGGTATNGAEVVFRSCTGADDQRWYYWADSQGTFIGNKAAGACLTVKDGSTLDGAPAVVAPCTGATGQRFAIERW